MSESLKLLNKIKQFNNSDELQKLEHKVTVSLMTDEWNRVPIKKAYKDVFITHDKESFIEYAIKNIDEAKDWVDSIIKLNDIIRKTYQLSTPINIERIQSISDHGTFDFTDITVVKSLLGVFKNTKVSATKSIISNLKNPFDLLVINKDISSIDLKYLSVMFGDSNSITKSAVKQQLKESTELVYVDFKKVKNSIEKDRKQRERMEIQSQKNSDTIMILISSALLIALSLFSPYLVNVELLLNSSNLMYGVLGLSFVYAIVISIVQKSSTSKSRTKIGKYGPRVMAISTLVILFISNEMYTF